MKNIFLILTLCFATCAFADEKPPVFEETDENCRFYATTPFAAEDPVFGEDEITDNGDEDDQDDIAETEEDIDETALFTGCNKDPQEDNKYQASYSRWQRYNSNFGMEKIFIRFPQKPAISQNTSLLTAYAYDYSVMYSFAGYFPPVGNIDPCLWFDEFLYNNSAYPYNLVSHSIFQHACGDWIMDYVTHDYVQNLVIKGRAIVTPFNAYILQCVKPNGAKDYFSYFLDNFWIKCECD